MRDFRKTLMVAMGTTAIAAGMFAGPLGVAAQDDTAWQGVDDGTTLTMWTRAATEARSRALVDAYNATHENQIELTVVPTDDYQAVVGAAAGSNSLPDLFSADVVFMPNWTSQGLFTDITDKIASLPYHRPGRTGAHRRVDLGRQEVRAPVRHRPVGVDVQQGALPPGRSRPRETADDAG